MSPFSPALTGALIGAILGIASYVGLRVLADRIENMRDAENPKTSARVLRIAALADLVLFPVVGFVVGPMLVK
jgi:hypothetical protein